MGAIARFVVRFRQTRIPYVVDMLTLGGIKLRFLLAYLKRC
jgi:hypothetical protein